MSLVSTATLKKPMRGPAVGEIRRRLGLPPGVVFDDATEQAVIAFQQDHDLPGTGEVDPATLSLLRS